MTSFYPLSNINKQGLNALQQSVAPKNQNKRLINSLTSPQPSSLKPLATNKAPQTPAPEKLKFIQPPAKTNYVAKASYESAQPSAASAIYNKNTISNTNKIANNTVPSIKDKVKTNPFTVADSSTATSRKTELANKAALAPAQPYKQTTHAASSATDTKTEVYKKNQYTQNDNREQLSTQINVSA
jgi:hypothetical protein